MGSVFMKYNNEVEVMDALGIESWRNLSKDKVLQLVAMLPDMSAEVALEVVEKFPEFANFALSALKSLGKRHESTLVQNGLSQGNASRANQEMRAFLFAEAEKDQPWEQKRYLIDQAMATTSADAEKDAENKKFLDGLFGKVAAITGGVVALGIVFVGGRVLMQDASNGSESDES